MEPKDILITLGFGLLVGWLASFIVGGGGVFQWIIWGLLGAVAGGFLVPMTGVKVDFGTPLLNRIVVSVGGAVVLVLAVRVLGWIIG